MHVGDFMSQMLLKMDSWLLAVWKKLLTIYAKNKEDYHVVGIYEGFFVTKHVIKGRVVMYS